MGRLVRKFGGTSVANIDRIRNVARHVKREVDAGHDVAVVMSAMAGKTNERVEWCRDASPLHDAREYDAVVASGEQVTSGLLAIALQGMGIQARSWQGWQIPIKTSDAHASARILDIDGSELINRFKERKEVAVIAGFQGINPQTNRITTLGRGGSDTSAVAVAAAIRADRCDIYTDVDGVYTIVQNVSEDGKPTDPTFTVPESDYTRARDTIAGAKTKIGYARLDTATAVAKVSVIGSGMRSHAGVAAQAFSALAARNINIRAITTSEIKFSVLIDAAYTELAVRTLHTLYGLDQV